MAEARTLEKLDGFLASGKYYEAEQLYTTMFARYISQKKYVAAISLCSTGARNLLQHHQTNSGAVVAQLLLDAFVNSNADVSEVNLQLCIDIFHAFDSESAKNAVEFLKAAIGWSIKAGCIPFGHSMLHLTLAEFYWNSEQDAVSAQRHLIRCGGDSHASAVLCNITQQWLPMVPSDEQDLVLARIVLQYLCCENVGMALQFLSILEQQPSVAAHMDTPLLNCCRFCT